MEKREFLNFGMPLAIKARKINPPNNLKNA